MATVPSAHFAENPALSPSEKAALDGLPSFDAILRPAHPADVISAASEGYDLLLLDFTIDALPDAVEAVEITGTQGVSLAANALGNLVVGGLTIRCWAAPAATFWAAARGATGWKAGPATTRCSAVAAATS